MNLTPPHVESLESRRLLSGGGDDTLTLTSGSVTGQYSYTSATIVRTPGGGFTVAPYGNPATVTARGTLVIKGTSAGDVIGVSRVGDHYNVSVGSPSAASDAPTGLATFQVEIPAADVKRVLIEGGGGSDRVGVNRDLDKLPVTIVGGAGNDTITGAIGDTLIGSAGDDLLFVPNLSGPASEGQADDNPALYAPRTPALLSGGAGDDTLVAGGQDSVVGGAGDDEARYLIATLTVHGPGGMVSSMMIDSPSFAAGKFGARASGVEAFETMIAPELLLPRERFVPFVGNAG